MLYTSTCIMSSTVMCLKTCLHHTISISTSNLHTSFMSFLRLTVTIIVRGLFCWRLDDAAMLQLGFREGAQPIAYTKGIMVIILAMIILIIMVIVIIMITARPKQRRRSRPSASPRLAEKAPRGDSSVDRRPSIAMGQNCRWTDNHLVILILVSDFVWIMINSNNNKCPALAEEAILPGPTRFLFLKPAGPGGSDSRGFVGGPTTLCT